jgi:alginate O-acetyltransferase complex protein AlgI
VQYLLDQFVYHKEQPMLFHHGVFLFLFANLLIFYALLSKRRPYQNWLLIAFSAYFYYKASGIYFLLLLTTISSDYLFSIAIIRSEKFKKQLTILGVLFSLSFLLYYKYAKFFIESIGLDPKEWEVDNLYLPIGISFYTFQSISYLVDVYRNKIELPKFQNYLLYMTFFPHLVAGPIVRAKDFLPQLKKKLTLSKANVNEGLYLISKGLVKKAIIADFVGQYVDIIYAAPSGANGLESLIATLCYTLQIFCDFSGYTDMAIGIALLLGYKLCVNFESPYQSFSITEFWRRWHISLSSWLRDFIYIPLGGNQKGPNLQLLFLMITMTIGGFWHGADWKFMWWGIGHGLILIIHKLVSKYSKDWNSIYWNGLSWFLTFSSVALLWIPFRALNASDSWVIFQNIFTKMSFSGFGQMFQQNSLLIGLLIIGFAATLLKQGIKEQFKRWYLNEHIIVKMVLLLLIIQCMYQVQSSTVQPFIYFQF